MIGKPAFFVITLMLLTPSIVCRSQSAPALASTIEVARADMRADRITIISAAMEFSDKDADVFWPIYRKYEQERSVLGDRRVAVIKQYTEKYPTITDAEAKAMAEQMFDCEARLAALKKSYFKKFNKVLPGLVVTKFFQLDHRLDLAVDMQVESSLPPLTQAQKDDNGNPEGVQI